MKIKIDGKEERVVYIEYNDNNVPHEVCTAVYSPNCIGGACWILSNHWDFFANNGDVNDIKHYNSGSGGRANELQPPHWADGYIGRFWIDRSIAAFKGVPKNFKELKNPIRIKTKWNRCSINPFKVSEEIYSREYCEICGQEGTEICDTHQYVSYYGGVHYKHPNGHGYGY